MYSNDLNIFYDKRYWQNYDCIYCRFIRIKKYKNGNIHFGYMSLNKYVGL